MKMTMVNSGLKGLSSNGEDGFRMLHAAGSPKNDMNRALGHLSAHIG